MSGVSPRIIKRYPNRKLYDLSRKRYVTLDDIALMIQEGADVQVVDHETGEDLTSVTLSQIIFEREKQRSGFLPKIILTNLVRTGGDTLEYLRRSLQASISVLRMLEEEIDSRLESLVDKGELAREEADRLRQQIFDDTASSTRSALPDGRIEAALHRLKVPSRGDVYALQAQVDELMSKIDRLLQETGVGDEHPATTTPDEE